MTETNMNQPQEQPAPVVGRVETDLYCTACCYNLYSLQVIRDLRLNIPVVRCPECGAWQAASQQTSAAQVWLNRLGVFLIFLWALFVLAVVGVLCFALFVTGFAAHETLRRYGPGGPSYLWILDPSTWRDRAGELFLCMLFAGAFALALGLFISVMFCHAKRFWSWLSLILPVIATFFSSTIMVADRMSMLPTIAISFCVIVAFEIVVQAVGLFFGLPMARMLVLGLFSKKLRPYAATLWTSSGKTPPWERQQSGAAKS